MVNIANRMPIACQNDMLPGKDLLLNYIPDEGCYYGDDEPVMSFKG